MNKTAIKNYAVWARQKLISDITYKAGMLGITNNGIAEKLPQSTNDVYFFDIGTKNYSEVSGKEIKQREAFIKAIKEREYSLKSYSAAFDNVVEEVAYTWFNRLIAIRFMEVNNYLPSGIRVLSSENAAKIEPDFVTSPFDTDLDFTPFEQDKVIQLKDENKLDELFRMLFIKQCNKLNEILPELFERTDDYSELLLTISFTDKDGIVYRLVHDIEESDFDIETVDKEGNCNGQVEIIGWMYQYYISEKHNEVVNPLYGKATKKQDIPAATQLFTTDWIVRYMVDNSLGRYWIERNPESKLTEKLEYFVTPKDGKINYIREKIYPTDMTFFDPCMGSGHILVYAFDVFMEIYRECGYSDRDAAINIVQNNLYGMDIDKRAYQLAYFAVMMKARSYNRRALTQVVLNNLTVCEESNSIDKFYCEGLTNDKEQNKIGEYLVDVYKDAQEIGTLLTIKRNDYKSFEEYLLNIENNANQLDIYSVTWINDTLPKILQLTKQANIMGQMYTVVCTNPPYMNNMTGELKKYVLNHYKDYSGDIFCAFVVRNLSYLSENGYSAYMTPNVWMYIKSFDKLRHMLISQKSIVNFLLLAKGAFYKEATVDICSFVLSNQKNIEGVYVRLEDYKGDMDRQREAFLNKEQLIKDNNIVTRQMHQFSKIPGEPISFWISNDMLKTFDGDKIEKITTAKAGIVSGNDSLFLRFWYEVKSNEITFDATDFNDKEAYKWVPLNKGGAYRKHYGNYEYVINIYDIWNSDKVNESVRRSEPDYYFKKAMTWSYVTTGKSSFRITENKTSGTAAPNLFFKSDDDLYYCLAFTNSNLSQRYLDLLNPTINLNVTNVSTLPLIVDSEQKNKIIAISKQNIDISKNDWDSFETSWDFEKHPLVRLTDSLWDATAISAKMLHYYGKHIEVSCPLELCFMLWQGECNERFSILKVNEEELNRTFIDIYGLQDELVPEVADKDVTVRKADLQRDIKSLISYAVGCMFGRYSLDVDGLVYAGGDWDDSKYTIFVPDVDNCIPITDEEYFEDDIVGLFCGWLKKVYGTETLEENLDFIASALGNKGKTSREVIRNYFLNDFIKDHIKVYQKRPIYWLFDSGKQNGFKALVYMHRWNADTIGNMRVEYLHRMQRVYDKEIERMQEVIDNSRDNKEISAASKRKEKLQKQIKETKDYDAKVAHLALSRIDIDLDDGVKINYEKVQTAPDGKKMQILTKIV
ncbi:MAG: BREX-1 system adenine-specific DNA-methyltransferase PglX [Ruminococcus sp.]|nr:BREX-1 system adenine-specific DNA-methyltransferase PglX [Ruminococcus sp.]